MQENGSPSGGERPNIADLLNESVLSQILTQNRELLDKYPGIRASIEQGKVLQVASEQGEPLFLFKGVTPLASNQMNMIHRAGYLTETQLREGDLGLGLYAIKEWNPETSNPEQFENEKKAARRAQDLVKELGEDPQLQPAVPYINAPLHVLDDCILLEFSEGSQDLREIEDPHDYLRSLVDAMRGVLAISTAGCIHSDVKPANIFSFEQDRKRVGQIGDVYPYPAHLYRKDESRKEPPKEKMRYTAKYFTREAIDVYHGKLHHFYISNLALATILRMDLLEGLIEEKTEETGETYEELRGLIELCESQLRMKITREPSEEDSPELFAEKNPLKTVIEMIDHYLQNLPAK